MSHFLSEIEILEALEEELDDSGSQWKLSECEENEEDPDTEESDETAASVQSVLTEQSTSLATLTLAATELSVPPTKRQRILREKPTGAELGCKFADNESTVPQLAEKSGVIAAVHENSTPLNVFSIFFPDSIMKHTKSEKNRYAKSVYDKLKAVSRVKPHSFCNLWVEVKLHEMYLFFGIFIHICLVKKSKTDKLLVYQQFYFNPFPGSAMARNRFNAILSNLHLNDNAKYVPKSQPQHDPMHKIRPILDHFLLESQKSFYPSENLIIDEGMCGFCGRVVFRVYIKNKPDKYGIKMFTVCDSKTG
ncbi:piggyBac transposable element-derived protein 4-like [Schistocerca cancellata]|uniref:piggyBac transposable element-derived protein 4-like n=1 Tax=Schistocerca cancellata TaxID=274614 RepID=UPI002117CF5B|nr:piggyBac transposable element-derived protein 4-like [Schistocerca cancellata]